ncbi:MAG: diguanylate cyclase, partial [Spirochaetota bacterium]
IYSRKNGIEYVYVTDSSYLPSFTSITDQTKNAADYGRNRFIDKLFSSPVTLPTREGISIDCVYTIISRTDVYPVFRDILIALAVLLVITLVSILLNPVLSRRAFLKAKQGQVHDADHTQGKEPDIAVKQQEDLATGTVEKTPPFQNESASKSQFSPESGLVWEEHLENRLSSELKRAASFDQDLVLALIACKKDYRDNELYQTAAKMVIDTFMFQDLCFQYGGNGFAVIMPNVDLEEGIGKMEAFKKKIEALDSVRPPQSGIGLSSRNGRLLDGQRLIKEADRALRKALSEAGPSIVGFRPDPTKYREYIASQSQ